MPIPNPNPNIADGKKCDNLTWSSNMIDKKIEESGAMVIDDSIVSEERTYSSHKIEAIVPDISYVTGTLEAGETSIELESDLITTNSMIDIYTDTFGVNPASVVVAAGSVTITFEEQAADLGVKVRIW